MQLAPAKLNRRPVALRVRDDLRERIANGTLKAGDRLPSEPECASLYGVNRATVREAYKLLEQEGLIVVSRGFGHYVQSHARDLIAGTVSLFSSQTQFLESLGHAVSTRVLAVRVRQPTAEEADALHLAPDSTVVELERFRLADREVVIYARAAFSEQILGAPIDDIDWTGSLAALFASRGHALRSAVIDIRAANLPTRICRQAGLPHETPWLLFNGTNYDAASQPMLFAYDYFRGDLRTLHVVQRNESVQATSPGAAAAHQRAPGLRQTPRLTTKRPLQQHGV
jgi:GntR family transcriptional regulator